MSANKRRVYITDHGTFTLFDMNISLPGIIELTEEQIEYINTSGLYKIAELSAAQSVKATPTVLSVVDGDRFNSARTISFNELSFKAPIMGTQYAQKAKNAIIVKKNSIYAKAATGKSIPAAQPETPKTSNQPEVKPVIETTPLVNEDANNKKKKTNNNEEHKD